MALPIRDRECVVVGGFRGEEGRGVSNVVGYTVIFIKELVDVGTSMFKGVAG